jgi:hypothetical protein
MANPFFGEASVEAGGQTWTLRLDFNAMAELEDKLGRPALEVLQEIESGKGTIKALRAVAWAMLLEHHPEATERDAGAVLSADTGIIQRVLQAAMPEADAGKKKAGKAA